MESGCEAANPQNITKFENHRDCLARTVKQGCSKDANHLQLRAHAAPQSVRWVAHALYIIASCHECRRSPLPLQASAKPCRGKCIDCQAQDEAAGPLWHARARAEGSASLIGMQQSQSSKNAAFCFQAWRAGVKPQILKISLSLKIIGIALGRMCGLSRAAAQRAAQMRSVMHAARWTTDHLEDHSLRFSWVPPTPPRTSSVLQRHSTPQPSASPGGRSLRGGAPQAQLVRGPPEVRLPHCREASDRNESMWARSRDSSLGARCARAHRGDGARLCSLLLTCGGPLVQSSWFVRGPFEI